MAEILIGVIIATCIACKWIKALKREIAKNAANTLDDTKPQG